MRSCQPRLLHARLRSSPHFQTSNPIQLRCDSGRRVAHAYSAIAAAAAALSESTPGAIGIRRRSSTRSASGSPGPSTPSTSPNLLRKRRRFQLRTGCVERDERGVLDSKVRQCRAQFAASPETVRAPPPGWPAARKDGPPRAAARPVRHRRPPPNESPLQHSQDLETARRPCSRQARLPHRTTARSPVPSPGAAHRGCQSRRSA